MNNEEQAERYGESETKHKCFQSTKSLGADYEQGEAERYGEILLRLTIPRSLQVIHDFH